MIAADQPRTLNTTTSTARLTLNILLSFARFEREVIGERIRDKVAASRKKGMWMSGYGPLGYEVKNRKLVSNDAEAATVRMIIERFVTVGSATALARLSPPPDCPSPSWAHLFQPVAVKKPARPKAEEEKSTPSILSMRLRRMSIGSVGWH